MRHFVGRTSLSVRVEHLGERRTRTSVVRLHLARVKYCCDETEQTDPLSSADSPHLNFERSADVELRSARLD